jgi:pantothenate kinase
VQNITHHVNTLADQIHALRENRSRILVAIAGAPASGKSTLAGELARRLNVQKCATVIVPMDGFHIDNNILDARGLRTRKGAPETFDANGFVHLIRRLKENNEGLAPIFDRARDLSVAAAVTVPAECQVVIAEGNYLMFDEAPWSCLAPLWDLSARVEVEMPQLRARLIQRWLSLNHTRAAATRRAESNDIPNAQRVIDAALPCDMVLSSDE